MEKACLGGRTGKGLNNCSIQARQKLEKEASKKKHVSFAKT
jgi:hypothetical protein